MPDYQPIEKGLHETLAGVMTTYCRWQKQPNNNRMTLPYCVYQRINSQRNPYSKGNDSLVTAIMQVSVFASTPTEATRKAKAIIDAIKNVRGTTWGDHTVCGNYLSNQFNNDEVDISLGGKLGVYSEVLEFAITYLEEGAS